MSEPKKIIPIRSSDSDEDSRMIVTMTKAELRELIGELIDRKLHTARTDRLVGIEEAITMLSVSEGWLYHNSKKLPFVRKVGGALRFSVNGMQRWMEAKKFRD
jgi:hypothetical protein